ncbi:MAG: type 4a pilus biogenesis protein PilO [Phycisphaerales bacterium]|jgi:Tfp pilus assembly protein PilO|nr:type 4a pilus biogenesis protein PilO [Phycisphaerales bacterium]
MRIPFRYTVLIAVLVLTPILAWATIYKPANSTVETVASEIRNRTKRLANLGAFNSQYRQLQASIREIENTNEKLLGRLPKEHQAEQWLGEASLAAESSGLAVRSVTLSSSTDKENWGILPVNMEVSGSFAGLYELIQKFERMERLFPIHRLDIRKTSETSVDATLVLHLVFVGEGGSP